MFYTPVSQQREQREKSVFGKDYFCQFILLFSLFLLLFIGFTALFGTSYEFHFVHIHSTTH